jgi:ribose transport system ATP-binding protein
MAEPFLELNDISKAYPGVMALAGVDLAIAHGEVVGLVGENGAGKSTLMKIMGGVVTPDQGTIRISGAPHAALTVTEASRAGIAFVHQELNLFDNLDVAANVFIGREPVRGGPFRLVDNRAMHQETHKLLKLLGADFTPATPVAELSLAQRQLVEIAKALSLDARIVIMDEPTSSLTVSETTRLLKIIADLKASGVSVIFISHRLHEVERCADRVIVLRDGRKVGELDRSHITHEAMIRLMIGRSLKSLYLAPAAPPRGDALILDELRTEAFPDRSVSLVLREGEILGLAGLVGSGRTELARVLFGIDRKIGGDGSAPDLSPSPRRAKRSRTVSSWFLRTASARASCSMSRSRKTFRFRTSPAIPGTTCCRRLPKPRMPSISASSSISGRARSTAWRARSRAATSRRSCSPNGCR